MARPRKDSPQVPAYRLHKSTGTARVTLSGKEISLGKHGSPESIEKYNRLVGAWVSNGRKMLDPAQLPTGTPDHLRPLTVAQVIMAFWIHAQKYYRRADGTPTKEVDTFKQALRPLRALYADTAAIEFGPMKLKAVREAMIAKGWQRSHINDQVGRLRHVFKWAAEQELIPGMVHGNLMAVAGLKLGRTEAPEGEKVLPVPDARIAAAMAWVTPEVRDMIRLQRLTGMRPQDVCGLRGREIDMVGWRYAPAQHKGAHRGDERVIALGPAAREVLGKWLRADPEEYLFSPARAVAGMGRAVRGNLNTRYSIDSYRRAIARACDNAFEMPAAMAWEWEALCAWREKWKYENGKMPRLAEHPPEMLARHEAVEAFRSRQRWHPNQLRHTAATELRRLYGAEAARVVLGHKHLKTTEIYAEIDQARAATVMEEVG